MLRASLLVMTLFVAIFAGFVDIADAATITVSSGDSIQDAIDSADPGDTIEVGAGIYEEDLTIDETIELIGEDKATTVIKGVANVPVASWPLAVPNIYIEANGVKIQGFTIEGPDYEADKYVSGLLIDGSNVEIYDNDFVATAAVATAELAHAVMTYSKGAAGHETIDISGLNIHDNSFTGSGLTGLEAIYINPHTGTGAITISNNDISGSINIGITVESGNAIVSDNIVDTTLDSETLPYGTYGIRFFDSTYAGTYEDILISDNDVQHFKRGVRVGNSGDNGGASTSSIAASISANTLTNNVVGIWARLYGANVTANHNDLSDSVNYGIDNDGSIDVDAENNWWGTTEEGEIADLVDGSVGYEPYSTDANHDGNSDIEVEVDPVVINNVQSTFDFVVTNHGDSNTIDLVDIKGNGNFVINYCPNLIDNGWALAINTSDICRYAASGGAIEEEDSYTFEGIVATPLDTGALEWHVYTESGEGQTHYPITLVDEGGPVIAIDPELDEWYNAPDFDVDFTITDESELVLCTLTVNGTDKPIECTDTSVEITVGEGEDCAVEGAHTCDLVFYAEDEVGNSDTLEVSVGIDLIEPTSSALDTLPTISNSCEVTVDYAINSDGQSPIDRLRLYHSENEGGWSYSSVGVDDPNTTGTVTKNLGDCNGTYEFYTMAIDSAGNNEGNEKGGNDAYEVHVAEASIMIDTVEPEVHLTEVDGLIDTPGVDFIDEEITLTATATDNNIGEAPYCEFTYVGINPIGAYPIGVAELDEGECSETFDEIDFLPDHSDGQIIVKVTDAAGNVGESDPQELGDDIGVNQDAPTIYINTPVNGNVTYGLPEDDDVAFNMTICDTGIGVDTATLEIDIGEGTYELVDFTAPSFAAPDVDGCTEFTGTLENVSKDTGWVTDIVIEDYDEKIGENTTVFILRDEVTVDITYGWGATSVPFDLEIADADQLFGGGDVSFVVKYDNTLLSDGIDNDGNGEVDEANEAWLYFSNDGNNTNDDFTGIDVGDGYLMWSNGPTDVTVQSSGIPDPITYVPNYGWNLIGFMSYEPQYASDYLDAGDWDELSTMHDSEECVPYDSVSEEYVFMPGHAFWGYLRAAPDISIVSGPTEICDDSYFIGA